MRKRRWSLEAGDPYSRWSLLAVGRYNMTVKSLLKITCFTLPSILKYHVFFTEWDCSRQDSCKYMIVRPIRKTDNKDKRITQSERQTQHKPSANIQLNMVGNWYLTSFSRLVSVIVTPAALLRKEMFDTYS